MQPVLQFLRYFLVGAVIASSFFGEGVMAADSTLNPNASPSSGTYRDSTTLTTSASSNGPISGPAFNNLQTPTPTPTSDENKFYVGIISFGNITITIILTLLAPLLLLANWLLTPDWTYGEMFGLRPALYNIWVFMSNIVYLIFGFALVVIAFMNIFGRSSYAIKATLPKLILGVITVPFTWFFVSFILSIVNVLTLSVSQSPMTLLPESSKSSTFEMCDEYNISFKDISIGDVTPDTCANGEEKKSKSFNELFSGKGAYSVLSVYAYGILRIDNIKSLKQPVVQDGANKGKIDVDAISQGGKSTASALARVTVQLIVGLLFVLVFFILLVALVFALFTRAFTLWFFIALSPIFSLFPLMGKGMEKIGALKNMSIGHFLGAAMVPVYVGAALSFGIMFLSLINIIGANQTNKALNNFSATKFISSGSGDLVVEGLGSKYTISNFPTWLSSGTDVVATGTKEFGKTSIGGFILMILAIAVLWVAVMAALNSSEITKSAVEPIASMGGEISKLVKQAPNLMPIPYTGGQSLSSLRQATSSVTQAVQGTASARGSTLGSDIASKLGINTEEQRRRDDAIRLVAHNTLAVAEQQKSAVDQLRNIASTFGNLDEMKKNQQAMDAFRKVATKFNIPNFSGSREEFVTLDTNIHGSGGILAGGLTNNISDRLAKDEVPFLFRGGSLSATAQQANAAAPAAPPAAVRGPLTIGSNIQVSLTQSEGPQIIIQAAASITGKSQIVDIPNNLKANPSAIGAALKGTVNPASITQEFADNLWRALGNPAPVPPNIVNNIKSTMS